MRVGRSTSWTASDRPRGSRDSGGPPELGRPPEGTTKKLTVASVGTNEELDCRFTRYVGRASTVSFRAMKSSPTGWWTVPRSTNQSALRPVSYPVISSAESTRADFERFRLMLPASSSTRLSSRPSVLRRYRDNGDGIRGAMGDSSWLDPWLWGPEGQSEIGRSPWTPRTWRLRHERFGQSNRGLNRRVSSISALQVSSAILRPPRWEGASRDATGELWM